MQNTLLNMICDYISTQNAEYTIPPKKAILNHSLLIDTPTKNDIF